jgi:hypothetical protein
VEEGAQYCEVVARPTLFHCAGLFLDMGGEEDVKWVVIGWVVWVYGCKYKVVVLTAQGVIFLVLLALKSERIPVKPGTINMK